MSLFFCSRPFVYPVDKTFGSDPIVIYTLSAQG